MTTPSPDAYNLGKYGEVPVSYYTGLPTIEIPLYTIKTRTVELPVKLLYHAGATKVKDEASMVGLGWSLSAGGSITQNIVDVNDFAGTPRYWGGPGNWVANTFTEIASQKANCVFSGIGPGYPPQQSELTAYFGLFGAMDRLIDLEPDIFSFSFLGYSGKFFYVRETHEFVVLDQQNIKFELVQDPTSEVNKEMLDWKVTLPDGTVLFFEVFEFVEGPRDDGQTAIVEMRNITWYVTRIETINHETIEFTYDRSPATTLHPSATSPMLPSVFEKASRYIRTSSAGLLEGDALPLFQYDYHVKAYLTYLQTITFDGGRVDLSYSSRTDQSGQRLTRVDIYGGKVGSQTLMKRYQMNNSSYFEATTAYPHSLLSTYRSSDGLTDSYFSQRLKLSSVQETVTSATWTFDYNSRQLPYKDSWAVDHWGFNCARGNTTFVPDLTKVYAAADIMPIVTQDQMTFAGSDRSADPDAVKAALLEKIHYPTGGYTQFDYESHTFGNYPTIEPHSNLNSLGGGARVARITDADGSGNVRIKRLLYFGGKLMSPLQYQRSYSYQKKSCVGWNEVATFTYYIVEGESHTALSSSAQGQHVGYSQVEVRDGENGENGKEMYYFHNSPDQTYRYSWSIPTSVPNNPDRRNGFIDSREVFDKDGHLLLKENYTYASNFGRLRSAAGMKTYMTMATTVCDYDCNEFGAIGYGIFAGQDLLASKEIRTLNTATSNEYQVETENYTYNAIGLLTETRQHRSDGSDLYTRSKFPYDYVSAVPIPPASLTPELSAIYKLNNTNRHNQALEIVTSVNDKVTSSTYTQFADKNNSNTNPLLVPVSEFQFRSRTPVTFSQTSSTSTFEMSSINTSTTPASVTKDEHYAPNPEIVFDAFDASGRLLQYHKNDNVNTSFIWGYGGKYVIASIINAKQKDIYYTGFESDSGPNTDATDRKTGNQSHINSTDLSIPLSGLSNGKYILSYWKKVSGVWTYVESKVTVSGGSYTISGLDGQVDDLRFYPDGAQMTTYTHDFEKGMSSLTDANNVTTYYGYDTSGRLIDIKDLDKNLLQHIDYHFKP